jgi:toxin-antitoxin system PIN domain toxin
MNGAEPVGLPRVVLFGFLRLATSSRVYSSPMTVEEAADCIKGWTERPHVIELDGGTTHVTEVVDLVLQAGTAGNLVTDAQIAAIAIEQGATLFTNDSDFGRFPGLKRQNPLGR